MEDRVREVENKLTKLEASISTSRWWAAVIGALIVGFMGATSFYTIPSQISKSFSEQGVNDLHSKLKKLVLDADADYKQIANFKKESDKLTTTQLFKCPLSSWAGAKEENKVWVSYGCNGQISSEAKCVTNMWTDKHVQLTENCSPIALYERK